MDERAAEFVFLHHQNEFDKSTLSLLANEDERFRGAIENTHPAKGPSVEDLCGETQDLEPIGEKATLNEYFKELWQRRHVISRSRKFDHG
ncbi:hypothetical protein [Enteractinococcus helveticum]|uniref:hypothetical protein n=1 Tax=Enteractinococcus helveticum TaxID=1837282 RepID=UPI000AEDC3E5|nr:hypothetical protein [Enteractinococcus helveticum]